MILDLDIFGVYVPGLLALACAAYFLNKLVHRALASAGLYRLIWHPSLFDACIFIILLGGLTALSQRFIS